MSWVLTPYQKHAVQMGVCPHQWVAFHSDSVFLRSTLV